MRKFLIFIFSFLIILTAFSKEVTVSGKLNLGDINLGGIKINFISSDNSTLSTETDQLGDFKISLPPRHFRIKLQSNNYILNSDDDQLYKFDNPDSSYFLSLTAKEIPSFIDGFVVNEQGATISETLLIIKSAGIEEKITNEPNGYFKANLSPGTFTIFAEHKDYLPKIIVKDIKSASSITNFKVVLEKEFHSLSGAVTNGIVALRDVVVTIKSSDGSYNQTLSTSENGYFEFLNIPKGVPITITASLLGYKTFSINEALDINFQNFIIILNK